MIKIVSPVLFSCQICALKICLCISATKNLQESLAIKWCLSFLHEGCIKLISPSHVLQDITSLLHTIYEVVDASVNHSPSSSKTLRVKLSVAPDSSQRWRSYTQGAAGKASLSTVGGGGEGIFGSPPLSCLLSAHLEMCLLSCRKASASGLSELCSS